MPENIGIKFRVEGIGYRVEGAEFKELLKALYLDYPKPYSPVGKGKYL